MTYLEMFVYELWAFTQANGMPPTKCLCSQRWIDEMRWELMPGICMARPDDKCTTIHGIPIEVKLFNDFNFILMIDKREAAL